MKKELDVIKEKNEGLGISSHPRLPHLPNRSLFYCYVTGATVGCAIAVDEYSFV